MNDEQRDMKEEISRLLNKKLMNTYDKETFSSKINRYCFISFYFFLYPTLMEILYLMGIMQKTIYSPDSVIGLFAFFCLLSLFVGIYTNNQPKTELIKKND